MPEWTEEETELAKRLMRANASDEEFWAAVGRSKKVAVQRLDRQRYRASIDKRPMPSTMKVPESVIEDRNRRLMARKSLTGMLMGDPPFPAEKRFG